MAKKDDTERMSSILSYFIIGIIWYFADEKVRKSEFTKFHVKQALNLLIFSVVLGILLGWITFFSFGFFRVFAWIIQLALFVLWIIGLINAINSKKEKIPVIGQFAERYLTF
ncbi:MAG: DUF4870 domain-containing protein [archaeon]|nr:DUF4870 domain-containing protein [archaeon]